MSAALLWHKKIFELILMSMIIFMMEIFNGFYNFISDYLIVSVQAFRTVNYNTSSIS